MSEPQDYLQPDFFRFGWDQFFLVDVVTQHTRWRAPRVAMDFGAGSGVLICELSQRLEIDHTHVVEVQRAAWEESLLHNLERFGRMKSHELHWNKISEFNPDGLLQAQLIVCNPPYFVPRDTRPSPDERRNIAHRLIVDEWQSWVDAMVRSLAPGGEAWWLHRDPGPRGKPQFPQNFEWTHVARSGRMRVIRLTRLDVE